MSVIKLRVRLVHYCVSRRVTSDSKHDCVHVLVSARPLHVYAKRKPDVRSVICIVYRVVEILLIDFVGKYVVVVRL